VVIFLLYYEIQRPISLLESLELFGEELKDVVMLRSLNDELKKRMLRLASLKVPRRVTVIGD
jgi:hypothetical protein